MAGIPLYFVDLQDDLDDFGFEDYGPDCESMRITAFLDIPGQDNLTPLGRLEKYAFSDNIFNRQIITRGLLDVFRDFNHNEEDFLTVMSIVVRLSEDTEPTVRTELMEQIPPIAIFLQESRPNFPAAFSEYLMPIVVRYLTDPNNQVRKASQDSLLILLDQQLIAQHDIENKVCPILLELSAPESDDEYKVEAVNIICKMASMVNKSTLERLLLPRFCELCSDGKLFQVRKVCAASFGDICSAVGQEATEKNLIPKFFELCSDNIWGMRKACAECFMAVSCTVSPEVRRTKLSPLFIGLISDPCRWVRQAAFQSLGPFISTFANPSSAGLYIREDGTLSIRPCTPCPDHSANLKPSRSEESMENKLASLAVESSFTPVVCSEISHLDAQNQCSAIHINFGIDQTILPQGDETFLTNDIKNCQTNEYQEISSRIQSGQDVFNTFLYWRPPLPDISQDIELLQGKTERHESTSISEVLYNNCVASSEIKKVLQSLQEHMDDPDVQAQVQVLSAALRAAHLDSVGGCDSRQNVEINDTYQEDIPNLVCTSRTDENILSSLPSLADVIELPDPTIIQNARSEEQHNDVNKALEAQENDPRLEEDKSKLQDIIPQPLLEQYLSMTDPARAQTVDTEIAKHCAYSLPGVALTLGRQNWHCLKDTYETLASDVQWKVRRTLAFSIHELAVILGDQLTAADLVPIFNGFLKDLDEVRIGILKHLYDFLKLQTVAILQKFYAYNATSLGLNFINELIMRFRHCSKWVGRQAFAFICQAVVEEECLPVDQFVEHLLPSLLSLASDPVPNVRVLLAKALRQTLLEKAYFRSVGNPHLDAVEEAVLVLQADRDQDVSFFATIKPKLSNMHITLLEKQN
ncbi:serine/threonine-protein phosphatase 4 regulatory subunit 1 [Protobothrops mucrosquamatus]|uniref:serine/threonine-protein phosphatase 4 regulatory subunit 1 n=1 Tax=Protobothrops mucrosquamatus TaxID=103944 RepID=UPI000775AA10|nr:serine/threonine-protein phosphatase 4 regulatory subunit 1 [Protobothrops mucrosquamatus]